MNITRLPFELMQVDNIVAFSDFIEDQSDITWIDTITDSGSATVGDAVGGIMALVPSDGSVADNDETYIACPNEIFKLAAGKPLYGVCRLQFTEANTDDANVGFFFQNAIGANSILDNGAGLKVSGDTIGIYKVDGGTVWKCVTVVNGGTALVNTSTTTAGGSSYQKLEIFVEEESSTQIVATFKVDGDYLLDSTTGLRIRHVFAFASSTEMQVGAGVKNGDTNNETLNIDYIGACQVR